MEVSDAESETQANFLNIPLLQLIWKAYERTVPVGTVLFDFTEVLRKGDKGTYIALLDCVEVKKMTTKKEQKICWS